MLTRILWILLSILGLIFLAGAVDSSPGVALTSVIMGSSMLVAGGYMIYHIRKHAAKEIPTVKRLQKEIVEVRCEYCGTLNELSTTKHCPNCGAVVK